MQALHRLVLIASSLSQAYYVTFLFVFTLYMVIVQLLGII